MDRLATMRTFVRVVESGGFAAAAAKLDISAALASRHVMDLEEHLGTRLLNRTTRRVSLTPAGSAYYDRCRRVLADIDEADRSVASENREPRGILRVNAPTVFGARHLPKLIRDFESAYADVTIDLTLDDRFVDPVEEGADVLVRIGTLHDSSLVARKLCPIRMVTAASPDYLARHGTPRTPAELAGHNCLEYSYARSGTEWVLGTGSAKTSVTVSGTLRSNNGEALCRAAVEGLGIVLQPSFICGEAISAGQLVPILCAWEPAPLQAYAMYLSRRFVSAKIRTFVTFLTERLGPDPFWDAWWAGAERKSRRR
jgi:DNA-binding transcriptional LysR family regulator